MSSRVQSLWPQVWLMCLVRLPKHLSREDLGRHPPNTKERPTLVLFLESLLAKRGDRTCKQGPGR